MDTPGPESQLRQQSVWPKEYRPPLGPSARSIIPQPERGPPRARVALAKPAPAMTSTTCSFRHPSSTGWIIPYLHRLAAPSGQCSATISIDRPSICRSTCTIALSASSAASSPTRRSIAEEVSEAEFADFADGDDSIDALGSDPSTPPMVPVKRSAWDGFVSSKAAVTRPPWVGGKANDESDCAW